MRNDNNISPTTTVALKSQYFGLKMVKSKSKGVKKELVKAILGPRQHL